MILQTYPASGRCNATVRAPRAWMCLDVEGGCIRDVLTLELPVVPQLRPFFFFFSITLGLELSDTKVYEP